MTRQRGWAALRRRALRGVIVALATAFTLPAKAARQGFEFGLRSGYAIPFGESGVDATVDLNGAISHVIPVWVDVGARAIPEIFVGAYFQYGLGFVGDDLTCTRAHFNCSATDHRLGVQLHYHFMPFETADPWIGLGAGREWLSFLPGRQEAFTRASGFEFVNLQSGIDFAGKTAGASFGPFVGLSIAAFTETMNESCSGFSFNCPQMDNNALHEWLTIGLRASFIP